MHYLMIKKCMNTGLKYLCKTSRHDPYEYKGSGVRWLNHIKKHKSYIITCVIGVYETNEELKEAGLYYSNMFNVVDDDMWANLTEEKGDGGLVGTGQLGKTWTIKDTSRMHKPKTKTKAWYEARQKIAGKNNYQYIGDVKTPWGTFVSQTDATNKAKELRKLGNNNVITDGPTLRKYLQNLDKPLHSKGRKTPINWRGKTPREIGFEILKDTDVKNKSK